MLTVLEIVAFCGREIVHASNAFHTIVKAAVSSRVIAKAVGWGRTVSQAALLRNS